MSVHTFLHLTAERTGRHTPLTISLPPEHLGMLGVKGQMMMAKRACAVCVAVGTLLSVFATAAPEVHLERRKVEGAPYWTYQHRVEIDEFTDESIPDSHYVSTSNFDDEFYENGNRLPRLEHRGKIYVRDSDQPGSVRLSIKCAWQGNTTSVPWVDLMVQFAEGFMVEGVTYPQDDRFVEFDLLARVDRKAARTFRQRIFRDLVDLDYYEILVFGQQLDILGNLRGDYDLQEFVEYLRGGKDLIMRIPGASQVFAWTFPALTKHMR